MKLRLPPFGGLFGGESELVMDPPDMPWTSGPATSIDQPPPVHNDEPAIWDLVVDDIIERDAVGLARYGTRLQPHNGRDALKDAYAEALDLVVYLRQAIYERDGS